MRVVHQFKGWKLGALAGLAVVLVTLIPQITLWAKTGFDWQGAYAYTDTDELAYSAYLNSLIQGRPRRNNPETSDLSTANSPKPESLFSIQFLPPYLVAFPARLFRLSASSSFILLMPFMAFASSLAVFWLLVETTGDDRTAAIGLLLILLCGVLASASLITADNQYAVFSFLRRYIPAVAFPFVFIFCVFVWRAYTSPKMKAVLWAVAAGLTFGLLVYSYFFLWTAMAAWFVCFTLIFLIFRPQDRRNAFKSFLICGTIILAALIPYYQMLSARLRASDADLGLILTRVPDLFRQTEIIGVAIIAALVWGGRKGRIRWNSPVVIFAASCAIVPLVVFNQQVVTGRSLQPFHYEQFIVNYLVLVGAVITDHLLWRVLQKRPAFTVALALVVGMTLAVKTSRVNLRENVMRDEAIPLFNYLEADAATRSSPGAALFDKTLLSASSQTSCSKLPLFWSLYSYTYGTISSDEEHERLFQYFYYLGVNEAKLEGLLNSGSLFRGAVFGLTRVNRTLTEDFKPISPEEIRREVDTYANYAGSFSARHAAKWPLSYVILIDGRQYDLSNLDRWYERDAGEKIGDAIVYRVRLRSG
ncbi:MAG TPA: hypothetical protein VJS64_19885 [Pyrinomonadaceae bacterium]|nr:hypothetical protein [Pyrinomonadaceae bacterium]